MKKLIVNNNNFLNYKQYKTSKNESFNVIFIHGLMSDMNGSKSLAIEEYCKKHNLNFFAFDNLGHGESSGKFIDCGISDWRDALDQFITLLKLNNIILIGSSMGGWVSMLSAISAKHNIKAMILIAPAPDFTKNIEDNLNALEREKLDNNELIYIKSTEDFPGIPISKTLIEQGRENLLLNQEKLELNFPVHILHGMEDEDVDYQISLKLTKIINSSYLATKLLKYSGHRFSSLDDIAQIYNSLSEIIEHIENKAKLL